MCDSPLEFFRFLVTLAMVYLIDNGFIKYTGINCPSGYVMYPLFELNIEKINEYGGKI